MIIGIDGNEANVTKRVGISEYAFELLSQFSKFNQKTGEQNLEFKIYLKNKLLEDMPKEQDGWQYRLIGPPKLWTQFALPLDLFLHKGRPDVFFSPTHYAPRFSPTPVAISVMDLSYIHYPNMFKVSDLYQLKNWTSYSILKARKIFTISQATKNDIINYYQTSSDKVIVTYPGVKQISNIKYQISNMDKLKQKYGIDMEYILFVGTLQPRKNLVRLIEAFSRANLNDYYLVIVGKKGWLWNEILKAPKNFGVEQKVKFLDFVPDDDLAHFYKNATCFVFPSLYEGFGLPILEAMKYDCPVITSNVSSLPEVGGDAVLYVDPLNVSDISKKISLVIKDRKLCEKLKKLGRAQVKKFSWEKTAKQTLKVLEEVANAG